MLDLPDWLQQWLKTVTAWDIALWAASALEVVWAIRRFWTKGWPALKLFASRLSAFISTVDAVVGLPEFIERTDRKIAEIHHETHKNDGSSIKDSCARPARAGGRGGGGVSGLYQRVDALDTSLAGVHGRLDDVDRKIAELVSADDELRSNAEQLRSDFDNTHPRSEIHPYREQDQQ